MRLQFSLRSLFFLALLVAVFMGLRSFKMTSRLNHIFAVPPIIGSMGGFYAGYSARRQKERAAAVVVKSAKFGALLGFISAAALMIEVGEDVRRSSNGEYWNWLRDFPIACKILLAETAASTFAGLIASAVLLIPLRPKPARRRGGQVEPDLSWLEGGGRGLVAPAVEMPIEAPPGGHRRWTCVHNPRRATHLPHFSNSYQFLIDFQKSAKIY